MFEPEQRLPRLQSGEVDLVRFFSGLELFEELPPEAVARIAALSTIHTTYRGQTLMEEGDRGSDLLVLLTARIEVQVESISPYMEIGLCKLGPGELIGEMGVLQDTVRSATIVTVLPGEYALIPAQALDEYLRGNAPYGYIVMRNMAKILSRRLQGMNRRVMNFLRARYL